MKIGASDGRRTYQRRPGASGLPKCVFSHGRKASGGDLYEFEVIAGNAAYSEGERFYLTPAQARSAYFPEKSA